MSTEIIVDKETLQSCKNKMDLLANNVRNRSCSVHFSSARGDTVTELSELAVHMQAVRDGLTDLYANTSAAIARMIADFETTDHVAASYFQTMGVIADDE